MRRTYRFVGSVGTVVCVVGPGREVELPVFPGILKHPMVDELRDLLARPSVARKYTILALRRAPWQVLRGVSARLAGGMPARGQPSRRAGAGAAVPAVVTPFPWSNNCRQRVAVAALVCSLPRSTAQPQEGELPASPGAGVGRAVARRPRCSGSMRCLARPEIS